MNTSGSFSMVPLFESVASIDAFVIDIILIDMFTRSAYEQNMEKNIMHAIMDRVGMDSIKNNCVYFVIFYFR